MCEVTINVENIEAKDLEIYIKFKYFDSNYLFVPEFEAEVRTAQSDHGIYTMRINHCVHFINACAPSQANLKTP